MQLWGVQKDRTDQKGRESLFRKRVGYRLCGNWGLSEVSVIFAVFMQRMRFRIAFSGGRIPPQVPLGDVSGGGSGVSCLRTGQTEL